MRDAALAGAELRGEFSAVHDERRLAVRRALGFCSQPAPRTSDNVVLMFFGML